MVQCRGAPYSRLQVMADLSLRYGVLIEVLPPHGPPATETSLAEASLAEYAAEHGLHAQGAYLKGEKVVSSVWGVHAWRWSGFALMQQPCLI